MVSKTGNVTLNDSLKCTGCGAVILFLPGGHSLICKYCQAENLIPQTPSGSVTTAGYDDFLKKTVNNQNTMLKNIVKCGGCGATVDLDPGLTSDNCPFCSSPLVVSLAHNTEILKPHYILPFSVDEQAARKAFKDWISQLWFAPSDLAATAASSTGNRLQGVYIPYWCFDTAAIAPYKGRRGEYYYVTETYKGADGETKTKRVRHTRWYHVSGTVVNHFTDILIPASASLPSEMAYVLEPWKLDRLQVFDERYLSGFRSETYQVDAAAAFDIAGTRMKPTIEKTIENDIGGDEQDIDRYEVNYNNTALKYLLMPVWLCTYKYKGKTFHFVVNADTGEVTGKRPYSTWKILGLIMVIIGIIALLVLWANATP